MPLWSIVLLVIVVVLLVVAGSAILVGNWMLNRHCQDEADDGVFSFDHYGEGA